MYIKSDRLYLEVRYAGYLIVPPPRKRQKRSNIFKKHFTSQLFRIGRMCRVGQKVHGKKNMLAISFFSPSSENQNWRQGQNPNIAVKPSASERMVPFLVNEIFQFFDATDLGDAAPFIQAYYNKGRYYSKVN